jgi:hypothetical protein
MNRSRWGFSSGGRGLRAGMERSWLELFYSIFGFYARGAGPLFAPPLLSWFAQSVAAPFHAHGALAAIWAGISRLFSQRRLNGRYPRLKGGKPLGDDRPALRERAETVPRSNPVRNYRPLNEGHNA